MDIEQGQGPALVCAVIADRSGDRLALRGRVVAHVDASGSYRLEIAKDGPSGVSRIDQSGRFRARAGESVDAGSATLDFAARTRIAARLVLDVDGRSMSCTREEERP